MSTPENSKCGPISKTLLTPCRRPGLSRKIKTPLLQTAPTCQYAPLNIVTTPKPIDNYPITTTSRSKIVNEEVTTATTLKTTKKTSKEQRVSKKTDDNVNTTVKKSTRSKKGSEKEIENITKVEEFCDNSEENKFKTAQDEPQTKIDSVKDTAQPLKENTNKEHTDECTYVNHQKKLKPKDTKENTEDIPVSNKRKETKFKSSLKRLSMKRSISNNDEMSDCENVLSSQESILSENNSVNGITPKLKKPRVDLCENIDLDTILELKHRIKVKQDKLDQLKRAVTYRKMHNVEDLQKLIDIWKTGCKKALNDLLQKLQTHGTITMERLLNKFNVPEDVINSTELSQ